MAGLVMPWILSRSSFRWRFAPSTDLPPLPPFPRPDMLLVFASDSSEPDSDQLLCVRAHAVRSVREFIRHGHYPTLAILLAKAKSSLGIY